MSDLIILQTIDLVPVIELEPFRFATREHPLPSNVRKEGLDEWHCYWRDSLADSGITGLRPIRSGSWHVPTTEFINPANLQALIEVILREDDGVAVLSDPDSIPVLGGGLALVGAEGEVLIEPGCCSDLGGVFDWQEAARHRSSEWRIVWIGHPWLSLRYEEPRLALSKPHESADPESHWAFRPEQLECAFSKAEAELHCFAGRLAEVLPLLGYAGEPTEVAHRLVGFRMRTL